MIWEIAGAVTIAIGSFLGLVAAIGILRFETALARLHAASKPATLGLSLVVSGSAMAARSPRLAAAAALVVLLQFITAPIAGHMLGRAAYLTGQAPGLDPDEYRGTAYPAMWLVPRDDRVPVAITLAAMVGIWAALWRDFSPGNLLVGLLLASVLLAVRALGAGIPMARLRPLAAARFLVVYVWNLVEANAHVAWEVLTPSNESIREAIVAVEVTAPEVVPLVVNAVTFTPGTLTVEVGGAAGTILFVHVLHFRDAESVRASVARIERQAVAAFGLR